MKKLYILILSLMLSVGVGFSVDNFIKAETAVKVSQPSIPAVTYIDVTPLQVIENPSTYLNKHIRMSAKFDKFATLGLDYPPAMRSHDKYISFLIQRPDVKDHNIPLSEFKIFLKKDVAEKYIDLNSGDEIKFSGKIFSTALGDPWLDVDKFEVVNKVKKDNSK